MNAQREAEVVAQVHKDLFIAGKWQQASDGGTFKVDDPATGAVIAEVANATPADGKAALDAAVAAQAEWAAYPPRERGEILRRAYELLHERIDDLALLMTLEMGKPVAESKGEITYAAEFFRWFAEEAVRIDGGYSVAPNGKGRFLIVRQPVGPVPADHAVELPDGHGHPQNRPGDRGRLHDGHQACRADATVHVGPCRHPHRGRPAGRRAQRGADHVGRRA